MRTRWIPALAVAVVLCGCQVKHPYPDDVRANFLSACVLSSSDPGPDVCQCMLDRYQEKYTYQQFQHLEARMRDGVPLDQADQLWMQAQARACHGR